MTTPSPASRAFEPMVRRIGAVVVTAMPEEAQPLRDRLVSARAVPAPEPLSAVTGVLDGREVAVVTTGIGVANSAAALMWAHLAFAPSIVVSGGSAGGLDAASEVGDVVIGAEYRYSIADATAFGYEVGQVPGSPAAFTADPALVASAAAAGSTVSDGRGAPLRIRVGGIVSGDAFVTAEIAEPMRERFPAALAADMESCALAHVASHLCIRFVSVRGISDLCGPRADQDFHLGLDVVSESSARVVTALLAAAAKA